MGVRVRAAHRTAHTLRKHTGIHMRQFPPLIDLRIVRPTDTVLGLGLVTELQLLRLKTLARWYARGLPPDVTWEDLLQEARELTAISAASRKSAARKRELAVGNWQLAIHLWQVLQLMRRPVVST